MDGLDGATLAALREVARTRLRTPRRIRLVTRVGSAALPTPVARQWSRRGPSTA